MDETKLAAVVMAAGLGTRMRSSVPKHLHPLLGRRMVDWVVEAATAAGVDSARRRRLARELPTRSASVEVAVQEHAARDRRRRSERRAPRSRGAPTDVLVLSGDTPLDHARAPRRSRRDPSRERTPRRRCSRSSSRIPDATDASCGTRSGGLAAIVEAVDASDEQLAIHEVNSSIYVFRADRLWPTLERLEPKNAQGELYLTDSVALLVAEGDTVAVHMTPRSRRTRSE